jgi:hypothetical protein
MLARIKDRRELAFVRLRSQREADAWLASL